MLKPLFVEELVREYFMAAAPKDEFVAAASGGRESPGHEGQQTGPLKASDQAVTFMTSIGE